MSGDRDMLALGCSELGAFLSPRARKPNPIDVEYREALFAAAELPNRENLIRLGTATKRRTDDLMGKVASC